MLRRESLRLFSFLSPPTFSTRNEASSFCASPFVYKGAAVFRFKKLGNLQRDNSDRSRSPIRLPGPLSTAPWMQFFHRTRMSTFLSISVSQGSGSSSICMTALCKLGNTDTTCAYIRDCQPWDPSHAFSITSQCPPLSGPTRRRRCASLSRSICF